ncbi:hypothetical protein F5B19DRAFT_489327 [Rostrohypoxylon terebratum]|nr:hypothetical protein F5B19DRAFT_489327 [Rostrohypoxylon terebratum]
MSMAVNVAVFVVVIVLILLIIFIGYGGLSSTHYFGLIMFRNKQAQRELRQQQRGRTAEEVLPVPAPPFWVVPEPQPEVEAGVATHATQTSAVGTDVGGASDSSVAPSQHSSTEAQLGRR